MNGVQQNDVFLSIAFQPTSDDLRRTSRKSITPAPSTSRRKPEPVVIDSDIDLDSESSSDEDLPDISTILKNHAAAQEQRKNQANGKGKRRIVDSDDDTNDWVRHS